jgi:hypothetical protein
MGLPKAHSDHTDRGATCTTSVHGGAPAPAVMLQWPRNMKSHSGVLTIMSSCLAPWGRHIDAGAATHHLLPTMTRAEALETTRIHCVAGLTADCTALIAI